MTTQTPPRSALSIVDALIDIGTIVDRALELALRSLELSTPQLRILEAIDRADGRLKPTQLAARLIQEPHSVSGLLNRLETRGLVAREHDHEDRRAVWVTLTLEGELLVQAARKYRDDLEVLTLGLLIDVEFERHPDEAGAGETLAIARSWRAMLRERLLPTKSGAA